MTRKQPPRKNCIMCDMEIYRCNNTSHKTKTVRSKNAITCSRKCARIYKNVHSYISARIEAKIKRNAKNGT